MYPGMVEISQSWLPDTESCSFGILNASIVAKPASPKWARSCTFQKRKPIIWRLSTGVSALPQFVVFIPYHLLACAHVSIFIFILAAPWAFCYQRRWKPFHRLGKGRARATVFRLYTSASGYHLHAAHRSSHLLYVGRRKTWGRRVV